MRKKRRQKRYEDRLVRYWLETNDRAQARKLACRKLETARVRSRGCSSHIRKTDIERSRVAYRKKDEARTRALWAVWTRRFCNRLDRKIKRAKAVAVWNLKGK